MSRAIRLLLAIAAAGFAACGGGARQTAAQRPPPSLRVCRGPEDHRVHRWVDQGTCTVALLRCDPGEIFVNDGCGCYCLSP